MASVARLKERALTARAPPRPTSRRRPSAFDDHQPPDRELIDDCVHCGFCLPTCPTYVLWGEEMDSPRGRIYLMKPGHEGEIGLDAPFVEHIDRCLGCMACVTACPSGVQYDKLIEATRPQIERNAPARSLADRAVPRGDLRAVPVPAAAAGAARRARCALPAAAACALAVRSGWPRSLPGRLGALEALLPPVSLREAFARLPERTPARASGAAAVALLHGCVQGVFFTDVNAATVRVLAAEGCDVRRAARPQGCCGALELHAGREDEALGRARRMIAAFEAAGRRRDRHQRRGLRLVDEGVRPPARRRPGVGGAGRRVHREGPRRHEVLAELGPRRAERHPIRARSPTTTPATSGTPRACARSRAPCCATIPGLEVLDIPEAAICCGSAGIYNMVMPAPAAELGARKAENISRRCTRTWWPPRTPVACCRSASTWRHRPWTVRPRTGARRRAPHPTRAGLPLLHPVQLLDASIRGVPIPRT